MPRRSRRQGEETSGRHPRRPIRDRLFVIPFALKAALTDNSSTKDLLYLAISLLISGLLPALSFNSSIHGWTVWICLFPLFLAIKILPPFGAGLAGIFWGGSLYVCTGLIAGPAGSFPKLLIIVIPALYSFGGAQLVRRFGFSPILLGLGWIAVEIAFQLGGQTEGLLRLANGEGPVVDLISRLFGYYLFAFVVAYVNASFLVVAADTRISCVRPQAVILLRQSSERCLPYAIRLRRAPALNMMQPRGPPAT